MLAGPHDTDDIGMVTETTDGRTTKYSERERIAHLFARGHILFMRGSTLNCALHIANLTGKGDCRSNYEGIKMTKCKIETELIMRNANCHSVVNLE